MLERVVHQEFRKDTGCRSIQAIESRLKPAPSIRVAAPSNTMNGGHLMGRPNCHFS
jgi:hypothetical protein